MRSGMQKREVASRLAEVNSFFCFNPVYLRALNLKITPRSRSSAEMLHVSAELPAMAAGVTFMMAAPRSRLGVHISSGLGCGQLALRFGGYVANLIPFSISGASMRPGTDLRQQYSRRKSPCMVSARATTTKEEIIHMYVCDAAYRGGDTFYFNL